MTLELQKSTSTAQPTLSHTSVLLPQALPTEATLGLAGGIVRLAAHTPTWAALFAQERRRIEAALEALVRDVQHIGSTAVPNLQAVPIVDIAVSVDAGALSASTGRLQSIGYRESGRSLERNGYLLEKTGPRGRTHSVHLLPWTSPHSPDSVLVRDHLRSNVAARAEYQVVKRYLALAHPKDLRPTRRPRTPRCRRSSRRHAPGALYWPRRVSRFR